MGGNFFFGLLLFSIALARAQEYVVWDEPEPDIWQELTAKQDDTHIIHKREVDDIELEGSGNGESGKPEISLSGANNEDSEAEAALEIPAVANATDTQNAAVVQEESPNSETDKASEVASGETSEAKIKDAAQEESAAAPSVTEKSDVVEASVNAQEESAVNPPEAESGSEKTAVVETPEAGSENAAVDPPVAEIAPAVEESAVDPPVPEVVDPSVAESDNADEKSAVDPESDPKVVESDKAEEKSTTVEPKVSQETKTTVKPSEVEKSVDEAVQPEAGSEKVPEATDATEAKEKPAEEAKEVDISLKQPEVIDEKQSGNAVLFKEPKTLGASSAVEGSDSDKHLASLATNEDSKTDSEQPSTGESAKTVSKAGKDTTVLIVLFVVVLVIGGAAFTHHMIKMRKAKRAETSSVVDGIRKSLQSLAGNGKAPDVEQGTEMKPLVNTSGSPVMVKEYTDKRRDVEA